MASRAQSGLSAESAKLLTERNLMPCTGGFTWTTDPRLRGASAVKLGPDQVDAVLGALSMPTLLLLARDGLGGRHAELEAVARRSIPGVDVDYVEGGHHFHMERVMESLVNRIMEFIGE